MARGDKRRTQTERRSTASSDRRERRVCTRWEHLESSREALPRAAVYMRPVACQLSGRRDGASVRRGAGCEGTDAF